MTAKKPPNLADEKRTRKAIAKQLGYPQSVLDAIDSAESVIRIQQILTTARNMKSENYDTIVLAKYTTRKRRRRNRNAS